MRKLREEEKELRKYVREHLKEKQKEILEEIQGPYKYRIPGTKGDSCSQACVNGACWKIIYWLDEPRMTPEGYASFTELPSCQRHLRDNAVEGARTILFNISP